MPQSGPPTLAVEADAVVILDQTVLPFEVRMRRLQSAFDAAHAIRTMQVRGAPLIGATAAFGLALALRHDPSDDSMESAVRLLSQTRPTAINLGWALKRMTDRLRPLSESARAEAAWREAEAIAHEDARTNLAIGRHGLSLFRCLAASRSRPVIAMTHCNAGRLATVAHGTALAPIYAARAEGIDLRVLVSETRPRNQGLLTAWELGAAGIPYTLVCDNACGQLLAAGGVDLVLVGADRIAANGDTANKVGTYLKALAARDRGVPFYVAAPGSTIDFSCPTGAEIPIEERDASELIEVRGRTADGRVSAVRLAEPGAAIANPAFDVTPARLLSGILCERGLIAPERLAAHFPERVDG